MAGCRPPEKGTEPEIKDLGLLFVVPGRGWGHLPLLPQGSVLGWPFPVPAHRIRGAQSKWGCPCAPREGLGVVLSVQQGVSWL